VNLIKRLYDKKLLPGCEAWIVDNIHYLTIMGSQAYHVSNGGSDVDIYGFCIPPKSELFPHLDRQLVGFGKWRTLNNRFSSYQLHHIQDEDKQYDVTIYNIVDYFALASECNPNMVDSLYTPLECVIHSTQVGNLVRERRDLFLSKKAWHTFKGYAYSSLHKMSNRSERIDNLTKKLREKYDIQLENITLQDVEQELENKNITCLSRLSDDELLELKEVLSSKRNKKLIYGDSFDYKFAYHVVRLLDEVEQILTLGTIDLTRAKELMKAIRRGDVGENWIREFFKESERRLEKAYQESTLPYAPREAEIKDLLFQCIEMHYGDLTQIVPKEDAYRRAFEEISSVVDKHRNLL
jgi:predicted nucleotidyltransferase